MNVRARKTSDRQRLEIAIRHEVASRLKRAAARRDTTIQRYVLHAIEDRIRADLAARCRGHDIEDGSGARRALEQPPGCGV